MKNNKFFFGVVVVFVVVAFFVVFFFGFKAVRTQFGTLVVQSGHRHVNDLNAARVVRSVDVNSDAVREVETVSKVVDNVLVEKIVDERLMTSNVRIVDQLVEGNLHRVGGNLVDDHSIKVVIA